MFWSSNTLTVKNKLTAGVRYPCVDQAIVREVEVECADFREGTELEMDGCKLRELDDVQWIQVKSL